MIKLSELGNTVDAIKTKVTKITVEQQKRYDDLSALYQALLTSMADVEVPAEVQAKLDDFSAQLQAFDDLIPDTTS